MTGYLVDLVSVYRKKIGRYTENYENLGPYVLDVMNTGHGDLPWGRKKYNMVAVSSFTRWSGVSAVFDGAGVAVVRLGMTKPIRNREALTRYRQALEVPTVSLVNFLYHRGGIHHTSVLNH